MELIGRPRHPDEEEKHQVHTLIEDFATGPLPAAFFYRPNAPDEYAIYPEKLLPDTWQMLHQLQLAKEPKGHGRHGLAEATGLSIMSLSAECCAGVTRARVTDRSLAMRA